MAKRLWHKRLWIRLIITAIAVLLVSFCVGLIIGASPSSNTDIALGILAGIGVLVAVGQWVFPFSSETPERLQLPYARELVRESASFRMGDTAAANFDYITEPIQNAYDTARQTLYDARIKASPKRGILILGVANAGKTRLAFEALTQTLPSWKVLLWNTAYDALSKVPPLTVSRNSGLVVFIDDLQEYVPPERYDADVLVFIPDSRIATLQAFLNNVQTMEHLVIVATCRLEDETRVGARLRWLFDQLKVIALPSFGVETTDPESVSIIDLFRQHGATDVGDWDGTLGSLVLGLSKKRSQYEDLVQSHSPAVTVLRTMKLLALAGIPIHTYSRIQGVCTGVFGESTLQEGSRTWQENVDQLTRLEFVTEVKDQDSGNYALSIRKDTYFDKVITDYPAQNRPYQLDQHFEQLQKVLVELNDSSALVDLAIAYFDDEQYEEALAAFDQAIYLDPTDADAYAGKGNALDELKLHEEALAAFDQAIYLDPTDAAPYYSKGIVLGKLGRHEEALAALEQAIRLDPTDAVASYSRGSALGELKRHEEALAAFDQAIRLDPTDAIAYYNKGLALANLERHEEALAAFDQVIRLDPNNAGAYGNEGDALADLERDEEALAAYDQAIRLDPNNADAYYNKGLALGNRERYEEALAAFDQTIRLDPNNANAYYNKGVVLDDLERYEEALAAYDQAIHLDPTYAATYYNKGLTLGNLERHEEALAAFDQALRLDPNDADAHYNKGVVLDDLERDEEALEAYDQAIHLDPTYAAAYYNKGLALSNLERDEEALAAFDQAIRLDPNNAAAYYSQGIVLSNFKRYEEALTAFDQALRLDPTDTDAYNGKEELLRLLGREGEA